MKIVKNSETKKFEHGLTCTATEYPLDDSDINVAVIELNGRYPAKGRVFNEISKELAFIVEGSGKMVVEGKEILVAKGDLTMVMPGEKFFWEGNLKMVMPCTPAWTPGQYKEAE